MKTYRFNALDFSGRILFVRECRCRDDLDALAQGERSCITHPIEIWDGPRLVARLKLGNAPLNAEDRTSL